MSDISILTDAELTECAELLEPLLSLRATALVAEVRESRAAIARLTAERDEARSLAGDLRGDLEYLRRTAEQEAAELQTKADDMLRCSLAFRDEADRTRAERDHYRSLAGSACPCKHTAPCSDRCTCAEPLSSSGCLRCCSYGSPEQRKAQAERLAACEGTP